MKVSVCVPDLFFQVKITDVLQNFDVDVEIVKLPDAKGDIIIANLEDDGVVDYKDLEKLLCFCSHIKGSMMNNARKNKIKAFTRMHFFKNLNSILQKAFIPADRLLDFNQLQELLASKKPYLLLDIREKDETSYGMIPSAKHMAYSELFMSLAQTPEQFRRDYGYDKFTKKDLIVLYCKDGEKSQEAFTKLFEMGYNVKQYVGGTHEYAMHDHDVHRY